MTKTMGGPVVSYLQGSKRERGDWLAAYACPLLLGISYFSEAPFGCVNLLLEDIYSVVTPRFC